MPNEEGRPDYLDPSRVRQDDEYDVAYLAFLNGITPDQVRELIKKHGNSRAKLEEAAKALKAQS